MNVRIPARRLVRPAVSLPLTPQRTFISDIFNRFRKKEKKNDYNREKPQAKNPLLENYLKSKPAANASGAPAAQSMPERGSLSRSSVFEAQAAEEDKAAATEPSQDSGGKPASPASDGPDARRARNASRAAAAALGLADADTFPGRDVGAMATALHPDPRGDARWARKMVIREVQRRGRVSRTVALKRREREDLVQSQLIKTSVKKLGMLARQIQGKPIDEAILQMRFSKKKAAKSVLEHLEYARDHATVARGMGLGNAVPKDGEPEGEAAVETQPKKPVEIELKDGRRKLVEDATAIYVDQAWVGRGTYGKAYDIKGRGRAYLMHLPTTSISVVLKEEATRIRQHEERQKKRENRKVWVQLPDRPIQQQRQHVMW